MKLIKNRGTLTEVIGNKENIYKLHNQNIRPYRPIKRDNQHGEKREMIISLIKNLFENKFKGSFTIPEFRKKLTQEYNFLDYESDVVQINFDTMLGHKIILKNEHTKPPQYKVNLKSRNLRLLEISDILIKIQDFYAKSELQIMRAYKSYQQQEKKDINKKYSDFWAEEIKLKTKLK